jgi:hypothetical protein
LTIDGTFASLTTPCGVFVFLVFIVRIYDDINFTNRIPSWINLTPSCNNRVPCLNRTPSLTNLIPLNTALLLSPDNTAPTNINLNKLRDDFIRQIFILFHDHGHELNELMPRDFVLGQEFQVPEDFQVEEGFVLLDDAHIVEEFLELDQRQ